jgi:AmmeMemoRadiSam system protein A
MTMLDNAHRDRLLALARRSIDLAFAANWPAQPDQSLQPPLDIARASFVTLRIGKQLRGCCGNLHATRALGEDVWRNAWAAAFADPRFAPLEHDEWPEAHVHLSVLGPLHAMPVSSEEELIASLQPHVDGVILEREGTRATFLPDVWADVPEPIEFIRHLKQKAGWPANTWSPLIRVWRYHTESFGEVPDQQPYALANG